EIQTVDGASGSSMTFDGDCSGRIAAVGPGVTGFEPGDEVVALGSDVFGSFAIVPACVTLHKPRHISFEEAATIPFAFCTAWYALHRLAGIRASDRILIHSAAGGVGLAAVQLSRLAGAEIFATAGNDAKREFLRRLGVEHVMSSRSFDFAAQIMQITNGRG